jgi:N-acetylmuramoyl-L-alanine amidase
MSVYFKTIDKRLPMMSGHRLSPAASHLPSLPFQQDDNNSLKKPTLRQSLFWMVMTVVLSILLSTAPVQAEKADTKNRHPGIIVLDPGHGGNDVGARGTKNMTEKQVAMTFVELMTRRLKKSYKVVLTRKDDYQIDAFERSAIANHFKADLFVSIHTGGSFRSHPRGISLYYHDSPSNNVAFEKQPAGFTGSSNVMKDWEQNRPRLVEESRYFIGLVRKHLTRENKDRKLTSTGAPLIVMSGIDMPAALIEIGYITNPLDAKVLGNEARLATMAHAICDAIDDFFSGKHSL